MTIDELFKELRKRQITLITKPDRLRLYPGSKISDLLPEIKAYRDLILKHPFEAEARVNEFGSGVPYWKWVRSVLKSGRLFKIERDPTKIGEVPSGECPSMHHAVEKPEAAEGFFLLLCRCCGGRGFWHKRNTRDWICGRCHPPAYDELACEWSEVEITALEGI